MKTAKLKINGEFVGRKGKRYIRTSNAKNAEYFTLEELKSMVGRLIKPGDKVEVG